MVRGFLYLVAIMDWHSRYVVAWSLSNTLDADFCVETLEEALGKGAPEIFNTDQGSQFTSDGFTGLLVSHGVRISMDGKGRYMDNIFAERLWRTVKYEEVRRSILEGLLQRTGGQGRARRLLPLLQHRAAPSGPRLQDTSRGIQRRFGAIRGPVSRPEPVVKQSIGNPWESGGTLT